MASVTRAEDEMPVGKCVVTDYDQTSRSSTQDTISTRVPLVTSHFLSFWSNSCLNKPSSFVWEAIAQRLGFVDNKFSYSSSITRKFYMNQRKSLTHVLNVRLDPTLFANSKEIAQLEYLNHSSFIRRAIAKSIDEYRAKIASAK
jgi:hypothetical protein